MGIDDADFYKAQAVCSNSRLYKQAGNGICVDVFAKIIENLVQPPQIRTERRDGVECSL
jgi:site-specific DNA-cytosine methylase